MTFSIHSLPPLITAILFGTLGIYIFLKRRGSPGNFGYAVWCYFTVHWQLSWAVIYSLRNLKLAEAVTRFGYTGIVFLPIAFYHFALSFLDLQKHKTKIIVVYIVGILFAIPIWTGRNMVVGVYDYFWGYYPRVGPLHPFYLCFLTFLCLHGTYLFLKQLKKEDSSGIRRTQLKYVVFASITYMLACIDFVANYGIPLYPFGYVFTLVSFGTVAYAILKHRLMDINVVIQKTILSTLGTLLAISGYIVFVVHFTHRAIRPLANFSIITAVLSLAMALFTLFKAPNRKITILWVLACLSIASWSFAFGMMIRAQSLEACLFWQKWFLYVGSIMIPVFYLHFVSLLVDIKLTRVLQFSYIASVIFQVVNISGHLATASLKPPFKYYTDAIFPQYHAFAIFFFMLAIYAHWLLFKRMRTAQGALKNQIQYVCVGTLVGFLGGCMTFPLSFNIHIFPIGTYLVSFYLVAVTYAIYKHHLMDLNVVLRRSLVYSLMTGSVTAIYLIAITQGAHLMQNLFGASTITVSIMAACFISAMFLPLRNRIQSFVDRYFFRDWADQPIARELAAGFSHELKSPLAGLSMQAQLALAELQEVEKGKVAWLKALPKIKQELQYLVNQAMEAARRIEAVRGVAEPMRGQMEPVRVADLINNSMASLQSLIGPVKVAIHRDLPEHLAPVRGDAKQLEIVFINLMKNALQAMDGLNGGEVHSLSLSGQELDGSVLISIKDTGPGIAAKDVGRIFEPYFTTKGHKGTGMGLYLSQQIIKAHGGSIEVRSEEGKGTEFIVRLPKHMQSRSGGHIAA